MVAECWLDDYTADGHFIIVMVVPMRLRMLTLAVVVVGGFGAWQKCLLDWGRLLELGF